MSGRKIYLDNTPWEEALTGFLDQLSAAGGLQPGNGELIPTEKAHGRVTAQPVFARVSSPHYPAAAMDGVAVRARDTFRARETNPVRFKLGVEAIVVDTGDPIPEGFDAVIMIEHVFFPEPGIIEITAPAAPWQHVRAVGEDIVAAEMLLPANHCLRPFDLAALLSGGINEVLVHPRPKVVILPTGSELVPPGGELKPGDIIESNSVMLGAMAESWGATAVRYPITPDDYELLQSRIKEAVAEGDIIVINAGSSAGREDFTVSLIAEIGEVYYHGVAIKPGKPVILGMIDNKPVLGIPGYPVSAYLTFELFCKPVIYQKLGLGKPEKTEVDAVISRKTYSPFGAEEFMRVKLGRVGDRLIATPISRGAGITMSLVKADGVVRIPRLSEGFQAGEVVQVELLRPLTAVQETTVVIGSHDLTLDLIANELKKLDPNRYLTSANVGSIGGLLALKRGEAHCAGIHLLDEATGEYNVSYVRRYLPGEDVVLVNLVYRQQGLFVPKGNPKEIRGIQDLTRDDVVFVNRQKGAGTRILLDYYMKQLGLSPDSITGYDREEYTHMAVAAAVASGAADAAMGVYAAAKALDLEFIPLTEERYDLCIPRKFFDTPYITDMLRVIDSAEFRQQVETLGGYNLRDSGKIMWQS